MKATIEADVSGFCSLDRCPPGLFFFDGTLCFKTEYRDKNGPEAYVVESGEYFWGGAEDALVRRALFVVPAFLNPASVASASVTSAPSAFQS